MARTTRHERRLMEKYTTLGADGAYYDLTARCYPQATLSDRMILQRLLLSGKIDKETGGVVITYEFVRDVTGKRDRMEHQLHEWSKRIGLSLELVPAEHHRGRATVVLPEVPHELRLTSTLEYIRIFLEKREEGGLVDFVTGKPVTGYVIRKSRRERIDRVMATASEHHDYSDLLAYLNDTSHRRCSQIVWRNLPDLLAAIRRLPDGRMECRRCKDGMARCLPNRDMMRKKQNERALIACVTESHIFYKGVPGSPRLYADGLGPLSFTRDIRAVAFRGCYYVDLKSVQLGILAAIAGCHSVLSFLGSRSCWWTSIADHVGLDLDYYKPVLKIGTYMIPFGAGTSAIKHEMMTSCTVEQPLNKRQADRFLEHPMIGELFGARGRLLGEIRQAGGMKDAKGHFIPLGRFSHKPDDGRRARSVLSYVAQSFEILIMSAIQEVVEADSHMALVAWIHDGAVLSLSGTVGIQLATLQQAVHERLASIKSQTGLDIPTYLEFEKLKQMVCDDDYDLQELDEAA